MYYVVRRVFLSIKSHRVHILESRGIPICDSSKEIKAGSLLGARIKAINDAGKLVDDQTIVDMASARMAQEGPTGGFILDGFPRTVPQAEMLGKITRLDAVIDLALRQDILVLKACSRRVCKSCGEGYNLANIKNGDMVMPPLLPKKEGVCDKVCADS